MKQRDAEVVDGDEEFEWEQIKADEHPDGRDWDVVLGDEYLQAAHGVSSQDDVELASTANDIKHARGTATSEDDDELEEILRFAGLPPRSTDGRLNH